MKLISHSAACAALLALSSLPTLPAQEGDKKITADSIKELLEKVPGELSKAAGKIEEKGKGLWERSKETLKLSREEYLKKVDSSIATMEAEIEVLKESGTGVTTRDYFQTRLMSYTQQLDYCKRDLQRLKDSPSEEAFRVKQRGFDRSLGFLSDNIGIAKDEAGL
jgi:uncharacterized protein YnzC (UPF0291/DUF896 family)